MERNFINKEINYQEFVGVIYDSNKSNEYFNFWFSDLSELDLTHEQKTDLANGWQYITIYYANNEERLKKEYYTYTENLYWIVYEFIKKYDKHNLDWEYVGPTLLKFCPNRRDLLGMYWVNRHNPSFRRMQEKKVNSIVHQTINYLNKMEEKRLRKQI